MEPSPPDRPAVAAKRTPRIIGTQTKKGGDFEEVVLAFFRWYSRCCGLSRNLPVRAEDRDQRNESHEGER